ncbi:MAG: hypothetical protein AAB368_16355, partial [bacterium]
MTGIADTTCTAGPTGLAASMSIIPVRPCAGQSVVVCVSLTNTTSNLAVGVTATVFLQSGVGTLAADAGPWPPMPASIRGLTTRTFTWTFTGAAAGPLTLTTTITAVNVSTTLIVSSTVEVASSPGALASWLSAPPLVSVGQWYTLTLSVTNTGATDVREILPSLTPISGSSGVLKTGPTPAGPIVLEPGGAVVFSWTYSATGSGLVTFNGRASGTTCADTLVTTVNGAAVTIQTPAAPVAALATFPSPRDVGQTFLVTLTVTNAGQADLNGLDVAPFRLAPSGVATQTAGPMPSLPVTLAGGATMTFTWTFTGVSPGTVTLSTTPSGTDANSGKLVRTLASSNPEVIQSPAALTVAGRAVPVTVPCVGEPFMLVVTVSNTGQAMATGVAVADPLGAGTGSAAPTAGPDPAGAVPLAGGQSQVYTWTATGSAPGGVAFTVTAVGTDANTLAPVTSGPSPSGTVTISVVPGTLAAAMAAPAAASVGQWIIVTATVTNTGGSDLQGVSVLLEGPPGSGSIRAGPVPAGPVLLPVGVMQAFTWTYSVSGVGALAFTATASGSVCGGTPVNAWAGVST